MNKFKERNNVKPGDVFSRLTVISPNSESKSKAYYTLCKCSCGVEKLIGTSNLTLGKSKSCGCLSREITSKMATTHGMSKSDEYATWSRMWNRCTNPIVDRYPQYGGRGIRVCEAWGNFEQFFADMGPKPSKELSIGRIDNDGNYCKENCRWETPQQQHFNTSTTVYLERYGQRKPIGEWAIELGISAETLRQRNRAGMTGDKLFSRNRINDREITVDGQTRLTTGWMKYAKIPISSFYHCRRKGLSDEEIVKKYLIKNALATIAELQAIKANYSAKVRAAKKEQQA